MSRSTEDDHLKRCTPEMTSWYADLRARVLRFGDDVHVGLTKHYVAFWRKNRVFAYVNFRPSRNELAIDIVHPNLHGRTAPSTPELVSEWTGRRQGKRLRIHVDSKGDIEQALPILIQSYEDTSD